MNRFAGHVVTKLNAVFLLMQGRRRPARILWRWMANTKLSEADMKAARKALARPEVQREIERLNRGDVR